MHTSSTSHTSNIHFQNQQSFDNNGPTSSDDVNILDSVDQRISELNKMKQDLEARKDLFNQNFVDKKCRRSNDGQKAGSEIIRLSNKLYESAITVQKLGKDSETKDKKISLAFYRAAHEALPLNNGILADYSRLLVEQGDYETAIIAIKKEMTRRDEAASKRTNGYVEPEFFAPGVDGPILHQLGLAYEHTGKNEQAIKCYTEASSYLNSTPSVCRLAQIAQAAGGLQDAHNWYLKVVCDNVQSFDCWKGLEEMCKALGNYDLVINKFEDVLGFFEEQKSQSDRDRVLPIFEVSEHVTLFVLAHYYTLKRDSIVINGQQSDVEQLDLKIKKYVDTLAQILTFEDDEATAKLSGQFSRISLQLLDIISQASKKYSDVSMI